MNPNWTWQLSSREENIRKILFKQQKRTLPSFSALAAESNLIQQSLSQRWNPSLHFSTLKKSCSHSKTFSLSFYFDISLTASPIPHLPQLRHNHHHPNNAIVLGNGAFVNLFRTRSLFWLSHYQINISKGKRVS